jgi:hypothetical protein
MSFEIETLQIENNVARRERRRAARMTATKSASVGTGFGFGTGHRPGGISRMVGGLLARTSPISLEERDRIAWTEAARIENRRSAGQSLNSALVSQRIVRPS